MRLFPRLQSFDQDDGEGHMAVLHLWQRCQIEAVHVRLQLRPRVGQPEVFDLDLVQLRLDDAALSLLLPQVCEHAVLTDQQEWDVPLVAQRAQPGGVGVGELTRNDQLRALYAVGVVVDVVFDCHIETLAFHVGIHLQ